MKRRSLARQANIRRIMRLLGAPDPLIIELTELPIDFSVKPGERGLCDIHFWSEEDLHLGMEVAKRHNSKIEFHLSNGHHKMELLY